MSDTSTKSGAGKVRPGKDPLAAELGRRGGIKGGRARAERLPPELRRAIAQRAAAMRWARVNGATSEPAPSLPGTPDAVTTSIIAIAGRALQAIRLTTGEPLVGQLSVESALGIALPVDVAVTVYRVPGEWQLKRGLSPETMLAAIAAEAAKGRPEALALLVDLAQGGLAALIDRACPIDRA
jgi:hypothetical protein